MKLKVGMYARTNKGIIEKIDDILEFDGEDYYLNFKNVAVMSDTENDVVESKGKIVKANFNIIDLIGVGDYVNGYKVIDITSSKDKKYILLDFNTEIDDLHWGDAIEISNKDIKSIVTKEQFESMEYRLGDK